MLNYSTNSNTDLWEMLEAFYNRKAESGNKEGSYRVMTKKSKFLRVIKPDNLQSLSSANFPLEVSIEYVHPDKGDKVEFILLYKNAKDVILEVYTATNADMKNVMRSYSNRASSKKTSLKTQAQQAYNTMERALNRLKQEGFVPVKEDTEEAE